MRDIISEYGELPEVISRLEDIETAAELLDKALLRKLKILKFTNGMDSISLEEKFIF